MKTAVLALIIALCFLMLVATDTLAGNVQGYFRQNGTYVQPYQRTNPDRNPYNNYNYPGNYNPNTQQITPGDQQRYLNRYYQQQRQSSPNRSFGNTWDSTPRPKKYHPATEY